MEEEAIQRSEHFEDFCAAINSWEARELKKLSDNLHPDHPSLLSVLSKEDWTSIRSLIQEDLRSKGNFPASLSILLLYLETESWDAFFGASEVALQEECGMEETGAVEAVAQLEEHVRSLLPQLLPPHTLARVSQQQSILAAMDAAQEKAQCARKALEQWCASQKLTKENIIV